VNKKLIINSLRTKKVCKNVHAFDDITPNWYKNVHVCMKKTKTETALLLLASLWSQANDKTIVTKLNEIDMTSSTFKRSLTSDKKKYIPGNFVIVDPLFLQDLENNELKMVVQIMADLKKQNALWHFDYREEGGRKERTLLALRKKGLLLETDVNDIHIVDPFKIRKGQIESVIATTLYTIEKKKALSKDIIKDLKPPDESTLSGYFRLKV
jgi:hypothetical protein